MSFAQKIRKIIKHDLFGPEELRIVNSSASEASLHSGISRALKSREIIKLRRGLYLFGKELQKNPVSKFKIANKLYDPSYISFESALAYYGLIPEAVYTTTSACVLRKNKTFTNELGDFHYTYIPCYPFFMGVINKDGVLIASPLRALFDFIYYRHKHYDNVNDLREDLRLELHGIKREVTKFTYTQLKKLSGTYKKKNVDQFCEMLIKEYK